MRFPDILLIVVLVVVLALIIFDAFLVYRG
jgi:hypothetical protein